MNQILDLMKSHRSIRKYENKDVSNELILEILEAATMASSSGNMQPYSIIITRDDDIKRELLPLHFNQSMVLNSPVLVTFCSDFNRMRKWLKYNNAPENFDNFMSFLIGMIDATIMSQNFALAAEARGLGICYMGTTLASNLEIAKTLKLPKYVVPVVGFSLGYPAESPEKRDRLPLEGIIHHDVYKDYTEEEIQNIYSSKEKLGMQRYRSSKELSEIIEKSNVDNLAQIYTKIKYTRESHIKYSEDVISCLREQGFL
ncbi:putative oxidase [Halobacteriovorax marinus SJ]|uniref:Oxidase n=1 Tax=Halobacteriovorax marinus (strain ATCC BAA-682 / DSM 15412 / SJ) TaxID=862908 RepID=E1WZE4_HALMS|nr:nitroreductase family protein [Halobacteriovorax marinus]CBW27832.1 putative oxidase [Halobacteriovorax marinus SJ]